MKFDASNKFYGLFSEQRKRGPNFFQQANGIKGIHILVTRSVQVKLLFLWNRDLLPGNLGTGKNLVLAVGELRDLFSGNTNKWNWFGSTNSSVFLMLMVMLM